MSTRDRVDWAAKKFLLDALQEEEKLSWSDPWLQSIDLEYHNLDLDQGLYYELLAQRSDATRHERGGNQGGDFQSAGNNASVFPRPRRGTLQ